MTDLGDHQTITRLFIITSATLSSVNLDEKEQFQPLPLKFNQLFLLPHMQVVSEPGAEEALQDQWTDNLVFAEGVEDLKDVIALYVQNETARVQQQTVGWEYARRHHALELFLHDYLL